MFKKILIANRGEIALRVICACRELGIQTVAVYSEPDENSLHVRFADDAVCIGPAASRDSYLNVPAIISAAEITGADAIHPGYGFLSESPYMAEVCEACHIKFIGPSANVIRLLGDKARARRVMKKAGVPVLPGSDGPVDSEERGLKIAKDMGLPVIIKAAAGGGGRGMRIVRTMDELGPALKTAQREAQAAFGVGDVYIEKYIDAPRHIEFQILGDHHGNVVHLGERECSIQRRHQKLIEEAPSMALSEKVRRKLGNTVVDAAREVQYTNAGTFEFLMDASGNIFFIEANTRLQVEHGVTELVTGLDIVKLQIQIAAGHKLPFKQSDIVIRGHAMECRINAEHPETFTPSPGQIHAFSVGGGPGVRVDTFAHSECTVSPYYDSLVAKLMAHGKDRAEAIARMRRALEMSVVEGIRTTIPLHLKVLADADYQAGRINTAFMERYQPKAPQQPDDKLAKVDLARLRAAVPAAAALPDRRRGRGQPRRAHRPGARPGLPRGRRPPPADSRQAGAVGPLRRAGPGRRDAGPPRRRVDRRQRPRRRGARRRAAAPSTSARTTCRWRWSGASSAERASSGCRRTRATRSTPRSTSRSTISRSGRSSTPPARIRATTRSASS